MQQLPSVDVAEALSLQFDLTLQNHGAVPPLRPPEHAQPLSVLSLLGNTQSDDTVSDDPLKPTLDQLSPDLQQQLIEDMIDGDLALPDVP